MISTTCTLRAIKKCFIPFTLLSDNHLWCNFTKAIVDVCRLKASCRVINEPTIYDRRCSSDSQTLLSLLIIQQSCTYHFNLRNNLKVFILCDFTFMSDMVQVHNNGWAEAIIDVCQMKASWPNNLWSLLIWCTNIVVAYIIARPKKSLYPFQSISAPESMSQIGT